MSLVGAGRTGTLVRALLLAALLVLGFLAVRFTPLGEMASEENLMATLLEIREIWWAPLALLLLYAGLAPLGLSMVPLIVAGAVFGPVLGTIYNTVGLIIGAFASFWMARTLGREYVLDITGERFRKAERFTRRHGFWPLVQTRFLPLPFPVVNFGAGLAGVEPTRFLLAAVVGLVPSTFIHSFFISSLMFADGKARLYYGLGYGATFLLMNLLIGIPWFRAQRRRRARYRMLREARAGRAARAA